MICSFNYCDVHHGVHVAIILHGYYDCNGSNFEEAAGQTTLKCYGNISFRHV